MKNTVILLFAMILLGQGVAVAQKGILRGKVIDNSTGEELIGAAILIEGTLKGASTDLDGNYSIEGVDQGTYRIRCTYISYDDKYIEEVEITAGEVTQLNIQLSPVSLGLEEIVVSAKAIRNTESALLTMQQKSATVLDGISSQQIKRAGDSDAAGALKRVTGINVVDGKYIFIRGLGDRYTKTLLNGAVIPGLDPNKNTVQMDIFPTNTIENILVYKTFTPELPGDFTGGLVDIITKDFPEDFNMQLSADFGYNINTTFNDQFLTYEGGNTDWLGMDDGTRDFPLKPTDLPPAIPDNYAMLTQQTMQLNKIMAPIQESPFMNQSYSFSVGNQTKFLGKPFGFNVGLSYRNKNTFYDDGTQGFYKLIGASDVLNKEYSYTDSRGVNTVLIGGLLTGSLKLSDNHKIGVNVIRNQSGEKSARYLVGPKSSDEIGMFFETRALQFLERSITAGQIKGDHFFPDAGKMKLKWMSSYTVSIQDEPDLRFFSNSYYPDLAGTSAEYQIEPSKYALPARYARNMEESNFDNKIDFELPFESLGLASKVMFGGEFLSKNREFREQRMDYDTKTGSYYNGNVTDYLQDEYIGINYPTYNPSNFNNFGLYVKNATDSVNMYDGIMNIISGYAMVDMAVARKIRVIAGARVENTDMKSESLDKSKKAGEINETDLLPSVNIIFNLKENMNVRIAYNRTIARPTFREISPFSSFDFQGGVVWLGNPDLQRSVIDNLDLRWEYFMRPGEVLSISGFYKDFKDAIEVVDNPIAPNPELSWFNAKEANVYGFEAEFRKKLDFINALKNFRFGVNITLVQSVVKKDREEYESELAVDPSASDTRVMFGQAPYIVNSFLNYENEKLKLESNLVFNVTGPILVIVMKKGTPDVYQQPRPDLSFNLSKGLGERFKVKVEMENLLNASYKQTQEYKNKEYIYEEFSLGQTFKAGISYTIK
ncbi:MAG: TonB-dependent receptor [Bacteroidales bacterium]|nr:TonB-dependent receptor [Bacteroidales bacterium]